ncbi:NAD(P)-dependent alcohol dehydrogenase [Microbulbifer sp. CAU 1566]|uniref:NAD(P)-dependent alcohol dehydrogenase n=1 Tax=Microbulbifer sp. CAU 1566 TaxID=2933269 RepID=UPI0020052368|nr:NAD(P)-dependent alcohol dehydrogenase [Microbulbifer sp. CAU 1566]MCK7596474.1 NAD(P)-dependent alcohol dehydrogenase [Microbulbifer sp. CAU 1566]
MKTIGYAAQSAGDTLAPWEFERRDLRPNDVAMEVLYCGICFTDIHQVQDDWGWGIFPMVPGHEIVGRVIDVGEDVTQFKKGDTVAVGCMVDSCQECDQCHHGEEQFCREGMTLTYAGRDRINGETTQGGYSKHLICREEFVLHIPDGLDLSRAAPLLCAGITTYSPLRHWNIGPGSHVGVIGLGGLGHMAVKLAVGLGADVTVLSRTEDKEADALDLGADDLLVSSDDAAMEAAQSTFDLIIDTIPVKHDLTPYLQLLDINGGLVLVGQIGPIEELNSEAVVMGRRCIVGSAIGGIAETQELINFCAKKNILPECEVIKIDQVNDALERLKHSDVRYRFVIDMASLAAP